MAFPTKGILRQLLLEWQMNKLSPSCVRVKAEELCDAFSEWPDVDASPDDPIRISALVLRKLDMMQWDLVTEEDIPFLLSFLATPDENVLEATRVWDNYFTLERLKTRERHLLASGVRKLGYVVPQLRKAKRK